MTVAPDPLQLAGLLVNAVASLGTLGALLVALIVYRRQVTDTRSVQARRVVIQKRYSSAVNPSSTTPTLEVQNFSDLPIYRIVVVQKSGTTWETDTAQFPPASELPPGQSHAFIGPRLHESQYGIHFEDAASRRWRRRGDGRLQVLKHTSRSY